jgi:putative signal transducing protein
MHPLEAVAEGEQVGGDGAEIGVLKQRVNLLGVHWVRGLERHFDGSGAGRPNMGVVGLDPATLVRRCRFVRCVTVWAGRDDAGEDAIVVNAQWVRVATFASGLEADIARASLEEAEIPVQLRGHHLGAFGPSFQGPTPGGVDVYVPSPELDRARDLLDQTA